MKPVSCGFLIESNGLYLIGHATQPRSYVFNPDDELWTIPKGIVNKNESDIDAAVREVREETGINIPDYYDITDIPVYMTIATHYKTIKVYHLLDNESKLSNIECKCNSIIQNKNMSHMNGLPEIDMFMCANKHQAQKLVFSSLKALFI